MGINWRIGATRVAVAVVSLGFGPTGPAEAAPLQIRAVLYNDADSPPEVGIARRAGRDPHRQRDGYRDRMAGCRPVHARDAHGTGSAPGVYRQGDPGQTRVRAEAKGFGLESGLVGRCGAWHSSRPDLCRLRSRIDPG